MIGSPYRRIVAATKATLPGPATYVAHLKALFENEVELRLLGKLCSRSEAAIDVGAFTGTYTAGMSIYAREVFAVEPQPWQAESLRRSMPQNVTVIEAALSDANGHGKLKLSSACGGSMSTLSCGQGAEHWAEITVRLMLMDELRDAPVGFIKIDAEGHEIQVLHGGSQILTHDKPNLLVEVEERHSAGSIDRVTELMRDFGYRTYFVRRDLVYPISDFRSARDQDLKLLVGGKRRTYRDYINNFLFIHPHRMAVVPSNVPSSLNAFLGTLLASVRGKG